MPPTYAFNYICNCRRCVAFSGNDFFPASNRVKWSPRISCDPLLWQFIDKKYTPAEYGLFFHSSLPPPLPQTHYFLPLIFNMRHARSQYAICVANHQTSSPRKPPAFLSVRLIGDGVDTPCTSCLCPSSSHLMALN